MLKAFKGIPPTHFIHEDTPKLDEIIQPKIIVQHKDSLLQSRKVLYKYLVKFKNYSFDDAQWMKKSQLKDYVLLVETYKHTHGLDEEQDKDIDV